MEGATHFIEQYRGINEKPLDTEQSVFAFRIESLNDVLRGTINAGMKTIAIWKIKYKTKTND